MIAPDAVEGSARHAPPASRLYWTCQFAGWGGFAVYIAGGYLAFSPHRRLAVVTSMLLFNTLACPAVTHGLRSWMYARAWTELSVRRLVPRAAAAVVVLGAALAAAVAGLDVAVDGVADIEGQGLAWTFAAFSCSLAGWVFIYVAVHERRRRDRRQLELTVLARDAQLQSLRAQVNPHFLFNCLNSLRALIAQDPERAESMVTALAELLRYSLASDRRDTVAFAEELDIVDRYLDLEKIRFEDRLTIERAVDPSTLRMPIPRMLVQALVENAVKHGISRLPRGGIVRVESHASARRMEIVVTNTGRMKDAAGADGGGADGVGLRGAIERLRLLYEDQASLTLRNVDGMTAATVSLPVDLSR